MHNFFILQKQKISQFLLYLPADIQAEVSLLSHNTHIPSNVQGTPASSVPLTMPLVVLKEGYIPTARNYPF